MRALDWVQTVRESDVAKETGGNLGTVRYYERRGLLPKPPRSASGYRLFPADATRRLRFIRRAQELGFSLREIRELSVLRVSPRANSADIRARAEAKNADIQAKLRTLESMKETLRKLTKSCAGRGPTTECPILESLDEEGVTAAVPFGATDRRSAGQREVNQTSHPFSDRSAG